MIHVEERTLRAFKKDGFPVTNHLIQQYRRVANEGPDLFTVLLIGIADRFGIDRLRILQRFERAIFLDDLGPDFVRQRIRTHQITDAESAAPHLVFISRANSARRGADAAFAELFFDGGFENTVVGKYE